MARAAERVWHMETPEDWTRVLRQFSPVRNDLPWLALRWFPMERQIKNGTWKDCGRWVLYECIHESLLDPSNDVLDLLRGPQPSRISDPIAAKAKALYANDYQCRMYREHQVWARNLWIIQGSQGGHPIEYAIHEQKMLQAAGLPTDAPPLGSLPYAPFDERVMEQLRSRDRLFRLGSIDALKRSGNAKDVEREYEDAERTFRAWHVKHLEESLAPSADFLNYYTTSSDTATECRNTIPAMTREQQNAADRAKDLYIETGHADHMDIRSRNITSSSTSSTTRAA